MLQLFGVWNTLDTRRQITVAGATILMFAAVLALTRFATAPGMSLLYSGLEPATAGEVVTALEAQGATYEVRGNAIFVDAGRRDLLRMSLARDGLPQNGPSGYELLDGLSGFGTTSQMFDAAYWRAKEGELARTISANPQVRSARVHISNPSSQPFRRDLKPSASVTVTPAGGSLSSAQAIALKNLVASAVAGLSPDGVQVIDGTNGRLIADQDALNGTGSADGRATRLKLAVERLLAARVGRGNAVVEVSVDTVTERESLVERVVDPNSRVAISTDTEENSNTAEDSSAGGVTVASNLPDGDAAGSDGKSSSQNSQTRERVNFEVSQTQREILREPGAIRRLTVAVLVNNEAAAEGDSAGTRSEDELSALRELVASAVGYDEARGDVITIKAMSFEPLPDLGTAEQASLFTRLGIQVMTLIQLAVLAIVTLVLGLFVLRPILTSRPDAADTGLALPGPQNVALADEETPSGVAEPATAPVGQATLLPPATPSDQTPDPVARLRNLIEDRQEETVEILRDWIDSSEEHA